jgi:hypothetical protein
MNKKTVLSAAIGLVLGGAALAAHANLTSGATLSFTLGTVQTTCNYGTTPPCVKASYGTTDVVGSWFAMDALDNGPDPDEKTPIGSLNGIVLGTTQAASGSHTGPILGTESPNIDNPWTMFGGTGMHQTTSPITATDVTANGANLDMSGWNVTWNGIASIPLPQVGVAAMTCTAGSSCSNSSNYALDAVFHVNGAGFTTVSYYLHLEGHVSNVPVPAAAWLFGSGLMGLAGVARRRKTA